jgi:tetratricopeptide (TPR) repeat protein
VRAAPAAVPFVVVLGLAVAAHAADDVAPRRALAERLAAEGRCAAALEVAAELRAEGQADAALLRLAGTCASQLHRDEEAVATLREALRLEPDDAETRLRLAIALYHAGDLAGARAELAEAERGLGPDHAELMLYQGLLLLEEARGVEAAEILERARARDPGAVEPVASYYAAVAWARDQERERALRNLERVERDWPGTPWAAEAGRLRAQVEGGELRRWARLRAGVEYDDNAVLQGSGAPLPDEISSSDDWRGIWAAEAGAELWRGAHWSGGVLGAYGGTAYGRITDFDSHYPALAFWLDRRLDEATTLRFFLDGGFAWVDADPYLSAQRASLSLLRSWGEVGFTELYGRVRRDDYRVGSDDVLDGAGMPGQPCALPPGVEFCGPAGLDERRERDRDGHALIVGVQHSVPIPFARSTLRLGYDFEHFDARGREYGHDAHSLTAGLLVTLPYDFGLDLSGVFTLRPYEHPSTFPDPPEPFSNTEYALDDDDRDERFFGTAVTLARSIGWGLTASASWRHERNRSSAQVFDYRRDVLGAYLTWAVGH